MIKWNKLAKSFEHAFDGLKVGWQTQQSFRIQVLAALVVVVAIIALPLRYFERAILVMSIALVLGLELLNSQLEKILDILKPEYDERIKRIKDLSAAAVLIASAGAAVVAIFIIVSIF
ncbi:MAG: diacylglycerol kinase [Patescibacteria group bacterium]|nr:diacylglycerol kinase [Patescibacteria group bacterium]